MKPSIWGERWRWPGRKRWNIAVTFRSIKQSNDLEETRVLKCQRLRNLVVPVTAAACGVATFLDQKTKLSILCAKLLVMPQRFCGTPPLRFYVPAGGTKTILAQASSNRPSERTASLQIEPFAGHWA